LPLFFFSRAATVFGIYQQKQLNYLYFVQPHSENFRICYEGDSRLSLRLVPISSSLSQLGSAISTLTDSQGSCATSPTAHDPKVSRCDRQWCDSGQCGSENSLRDSGRSDSTVVYVTATVVGDNHSRRCDSDSGRCDSDSDPCDSDSSRDDSDSGRCDSDSRDNSR
jgi:hypothetical protein